ncbi:hypothetical protein RHMOL_Rhmol08G0245400 [Rhododendron molle]|uniref:Uncharacterized protein n=1 Tax=Rhododendron molle TaxID=49168 RepID=A0ACC0MT11_RHOML|nr:hypothetical protein RHMOL_Rhmol08G0245400 [Rhododendron molle]
MMKKIKLAGYAPSTTGASRDAEEDDKESSISHHSEKLAIAFGLIRTSPGTIIRITKNVKSVYGLSQCFEDDIEGF